jgi:hypothetical protein
MGDAPEEREHSTPEADELARQRERRRVALRRVEVLEHGELGVADVAAAGERVPQTSGLTDRDHGVVAVVQQHDKRRAQVGQVGRRGEGRESLPQGVRQAPQSVFGLVRVRRGQQR